MSEDFDMDEAYRDTVRWEGSANWMYVDTRGYVTTGIGNLVKDVRAAMALPWVLPDGSTAGPTAVSRAFAAVAALPAGKAARFYMRANGGISLPEAAVRDLFARRVTEEFLPGLRKLYDGFDTFPGHAKRALLDMAYNLGLRGLSKFSKLLLACKRRDWHMASRSCHVKSSRELRNDWRAEMFVEAAQEE